MTVLPAPETGQSGGAAVVVRVRQAVAGDPAVVGVGGSGAETADFNHAIYGNFPLLLALVSVLTLLVLVRVFHMPPPGGQGGAVEPGQPGRRLRRAGLRVAGGDGSRLVFGLPATGAIVNWVPVVVFAFLYGLAIDYEVFISPVCARYGMPLARRPPRSSRESDALDAWSPARP
ncbi:MAG: hypothetical protein DLM54_11480 [Acidimicrobiales bacterium]|nr:MAG: hypothetical protein DLM54_11480 [Acidimicrobiales bacterium]